MIAVIFVTIGNLIYIFTDQQKYLFVFFSFAIIFLGLKSVYHGYELRKLKEFIDGEKIKY